LRERGAGAHQGGAVRDGEREHLVEGRRLEELPPPARDGAAGETLRGIGIARRRQRHRLGLVAGEVGRGWACEVGADGTAGDEAGKQQRPRA